MSLPCQLKSNSQRLASIIPSPISLRHARFLAEQLKLSLRHPRSSGQGLVRVKSQFTFHPLQILHSSPRSDLLFYTAECPYQTVELSLMWGSEGDAGSVGCWDPCCSDEALVIVIPDG